MAYEHLEREHTRNRLKERLEKHRPGRAKTIINLLDDLIVSSPRSFTEFIKDYRSEGRNHPPPFNLRSLVIGNRTGPIKREKELRNRLRYSLAAQVAFLLHTFDIELTTTNYDQGGVFETALKYVLESVEGDTQDDTSSALNRYVRETVEVFNTYKDKQELLIRALIGVRAPANDSD